MNFTKGLKIRIHKDPYWCFGAVRHGRAGFVSACHAYVWQNGIF